MVSETRLPGHDIEVNYNGHNNSSNDSQISALSQLFADDILQVQRKLEVY